MKSSRSELGGGTLSTAMWIALIGGLVYFGIMFVPPYVESFEVKQVLREAVNEAYRGNDDERVRDFILAKCKQIGSHYEIRDGEERTIPGVVLLDDDVFVNRDDAAKTIILQVEYDKHIYFPFTKREKVLHFSPSVKGDLKEVKY